MGILQGSLALCRYQIIGSRRRVSIGRLNELLGPYQAPPVALAGTHPEESYGWVRPPAPEGDMFELPPDAPWDMSDGHVGDGYLLRMRIERRKVPATLLQLLYKQQFFAEAAKSNKTPGPKERRELREHVRVQLLGRALPAISHIDAFWRDQAGELLVFTTGKAARTLFEKLFAATFADPLDLQLIPTQPPLIGLTREAWEDLQVASETFGRLSLATPVAFADQNAP